jgi:carboxypeptidase Q
MGEYPDTLPKIPHAAITAEDADMIQRMYNRGQNPLVKLYLEAQKLPDSPSFNVMGEVVGSDHPDDIIAIGGHSDSWDAGTGAHDDGGGCIATWQAVKLINDLGLKPKRTIRAVMWVNEENGNRGGIKYAEVHKNEKHSLVFEFDSGVFPPKGFGYTGPDSIFTYLKSFEPLLKMFGDIEIYKGGGGVDIGPMMRENKVNGMGMNTRDDGKYFWYHHSPSDTPDKVNPDDLNKCVAAIAAIIYVYSELP